MIKDNKKIFSQYNSTLKELTKTQSVIENIENKFNFYVNPAIDISQNTMVNLASVQDALSVFKNTEDEIKNNFTNFDTLKIIKSPLSELKNEYLKYSPSKTETFLQDLTYVKPNTLQNNAIHQSAISALTDFNSASVLEFPSSIKDCISNITVKDNNALTADTRSLTDALSVSKTENIITKSNFFKDRFELQDFKIPSTESITKLNSKIENLSSISTQIKNGILENKLSSIDFSSTSFDIDFPSNISISDMEAFINTEEYVEEDSYKTNEFDYKEFNRELKLINFSNDLSNILIHFDKAFCLANDYIDNSIKQQIYEKMVEVITNSIAEGLVLIGLLMLIVVLDYYLKDCLIYKHFIDVLKESKKIFDD